MLSIHGIVRSGHNNVAQSINVNDVSVAVESLTDPSGRVYSGSEVRGFLSSLLAVVNEDDDEVLGLAVTIGELM